MFLKKVRYENRIYTEKGNYLSFMGNIVLIDFKRIIVDFSSRSISKEKFKFYYHKSMEKLKQ